MHQLACSGISLFRAFPRPVADRAGHHLEHFLGDLMGHRMAKSGHGQSAYIVFDIGFFSFAQLRVNVNLRVYRMVSQFSCPRRASAPAISSVT
jgi:hypothetical protein